MSDVLDTIHAVSADFDTIFSWDYERSRGSLVKLYEKAKTSQWNASTDLDWSIDVDPEKIGQELGGGGIARFQALQDADGSPVKHFGEKEWRQVSVEIQNSLLSQFMHGEQGALLCTARIVETVPWIDAKYYAATQVMDEARHVEVFAKYLDEKLGHQYGINQNLRSILDDILADPRWDIAYLGMQIMVEGLALAAFGMMHGITTEPLLKRLLRYVMSDEARHVAFGVLSLQEYYAGLSESELRVRQEFAFEAAIRMRDRFLQQEVWDRLGVDPKVMVGHLLALPTEENTFQKMLFSKIVHNCKKLGLLDAGATNGHPGWLRQKFSDIGVIEFEDWVDTGEEYESLDEVAKDRAASANASAWA